MNQDNVGTQQQIRTLGQRWGDGEQPYGGGVAS